MNRQHLDILIEQETKLTGEQISWLNDCIMEGDGTWKYENGVVNVRGGFAIDAVFVQKPITTMPVQFGIVSGDFRCDAGALISLKGCPYQVHGLFDCSNNELTSLEYMPQKVGGKINLSSNSFILNDKLFEDLAKIGGKSKNK